LESLARLGIRVTKNQVVTIIVATISALVFNKLLPFLYPIIFARPLDWIFGPGASSTRDSFNTFLFTLLTAAFSFLAAYFISRAGGLMRRKKAHG